MAASRIIQHGGPRVKDICFSLSSLLSNALLLSPTHRHQKDERALPGDLQNHKCFFLFNK